MYAPASISMTTNTACRSGQGTFVRRSGTATPPSADAVEYPVEWVSGKAKEGENPKMLWSDWRLQGNGIEAVEVADGSTRVCRAGKDRSCTARHGEVLRD